MTNDPSLYDALLIWAESLKGGAPQLLGSLIGSFLGLLSILAGAYFNACLNRRRDDRLAENERTAVEAALYNEIEHLQKALVRAGLWVAQAETSRADKRPLVKFDKEFLDFVYLPDFDLYAKLSGQVGRLSPACAADVVVFYTEYASVRHWLPKLLENDDRRIEIPPTQVLRSVVAAVDAAHRAQSLIALRRGKSPPPLAELGHVRAIIEMEDDAYQATLEQGLLVGGRGAEKATGPSELRGA